MLCRPGVQVAEFGVIADVAMVHVRWIIRIERFGRLSSERAGRRRLTGSEVLKADIRWNVNHHRGIAERPRGQEKLFVLAVVAGKHWADAQPVGEDLRSDATSSVVDREAILHAVERMLENRIIVEAGESLDREYLIVENDGEFTEWLFARADGQPGRLRHPDVRLQGWVGRKCPLREIIATGARNDGVEIGAYDLVALQHLQDRGARLRMASWIDSVVVQQWLPGGCGPHRRD